jgi:hypothetical protein
MADNESKLPQYSIIELMNQFSELESVTTPFLAHSFTFPPNLVEMLSKFVSSTSFYEFLEKNNNPYITVDSWKHYLNNQPKIEEQEDNLLSQIIFLKILLHRFGDYKKRYDLNIALKKVSSLTGKNMSVGGTWFEIKRRLAGKLYDLGRRGESNESSHFLLKECIEHFSFLIAQDKFANDFKIKSYRGMRGTSYLLTARFSENPLDVFEKAAEDLNIANKFGDNSLQHFHYRIEALIHIYDLVANNSPSEIESTEKAEKYLDKIKIAINQANYFKYQSRRISFYKGQYAFRLGILIASKDIHGALSEFNNAVESFTGCFNYQDPTIDDNTIYTLRGQAYFRLYTTNIKCFDEEKPELLDKAIEDLLQKNEREEIAGEGGTTLPSALFFRANQFEKNGEQNKSLIDTELALNLLKVPKDEQQLKLRQRLLKLFWKNEIGLGIKEDNVQRVEEASEHILMASDNLDYPIAHLTQSASFFSKRLNYGESQSWLIKISEYIENYVESEKEEPKNFQFAAAGLGFIYSVLARNSREQYENGIISGAEFEQFIIGTLIKAYKWNTAAIECNPANATSQSFVDAGEASLRLARVYQAFDLIDEENSSEKTIGFLMDAHKYYSEIISKINDSTSSFQNLAKDVSYSKLGEVCYRLYTLTWQPKFADEAISNFETSKRLGNESPAVVGLTGDVYYRRGRFNRNVTDLKVALEYKKEARELGTKGRENPSVCSATSLLLWELTNEIKFLTDAIIFACESIKADPNWSWSYFQLAEISRLDNYSVRLATDELLSDWSIKDITSNLRLGKTNTLYREAINCALRSEEFERQIFRSRQLVYAIDDPHRLLNKNFIFKHSNRDNAEREIEIIRAFSNFLKEKNSPKIFKLPEPIGIFSTVEDESVVYVMRRSAGKRIGELVIDWLKGGDYPKATFTYAAQFLAYYHIWGRSSSHSSKSFNDILRNEIRKIVKLWETAYFSREICEELFNHLNKIIPRELPLFLKKDAHPENWLVSHRGNIVMIDLEAASKLPIFYEVVQLTDDYPLFEANELGWKGRIEICNDYLKTLNQLGFEVSFSESEVNEIYTSFLLFRIAFSIARFRRSEKKFKDEFSSASLEMIDTREKHFLNVLHFILSNSKNIEAKNFATFIIAQIKNKPIVWSKYC